MWKRFKDRFRESGDEPDYERRTYMVTTLAFAADLAWKLLGPGGPVG
jgi:hypothetical protein